MNPMTSEWVGKAEGDFATLTRELAATDHPNFDGICFHAQQCAEKYLKALLYDTDIEFPQTHDLIALLQLVPETKPPLETGRSDLAFLTDFGVIFRYPGRSADRPTATEAAQCCSRFRTAARAALGLPSTD